MSSHSEESKPIYKKWWFWVIIVIIILALGGSNMQNTSSNQTNSQIQQTTSETSSPSENESTVFLKNTNGKEFFEILCEVGEVEKKEGVSLGDSISYSSSNNNYGIEVETNKSNEINFISIYTLLNDKNEYQNFFSAISRLEYENSNKAECFNWINDNLGKEATTKIGNANFKLSNTSSGTPMLEVFTDGNENYQKQQLEKVQN